MEILTLIAHRMILKLASYATIFLLCFLTIKKWKNHHLPPSPISLPIIGHLHLLEPLVHQSFCKLSSEYGPLMYLKLGSVSCVVVSAPEIAKEFLRKHELNFASRNDSIAISGITYNSSFSFAPYGPYWKFVKKVATTELLGPRMLNQFYQIRCDELQQFLRIVHTKSKLREVVNVAEELRRLSNNVISQMMLSIRSSGADEDQEAEDPRTLARDITQIFGELNVSDFIWFCRNLDLQGFRKRIDNIHKRFDGYLEKIINEREEGRKKINENNGRKREVKDFLDLMLDAMEDGNAEYKITRDQVKALVLDYLTAATDTTAISTEWALAELINHPKVFEKAREEINKVVGTNRIVKESDLPNLPYIQAIAKEALRLHPPIPLVIRKAAQDCKINGYKIPKSTLLFVNVWCITRNPKYWKDHLEFKPERFLADGEGCNTDFRGQHFEFLPFGSGRRSCVGISLAMLELQATLAAMIQCFDWKLVNSDGEIIEAANINLDMNERPGLTAARAHDLVCLPINRISSSLLES